MENTELKEKYCREFGYGYFNKHNENEYTKWLESELLEALKQVKNNGVLDDVISCKNCKSDKTKLIVEKRIYCDNCVCSYYL
jgi:hypothetical protein